MFKPSVQEILDIKARNETIYGAVLEKFQADETFYECDFKGLLEIPEQYKGEAVVLPTARDMVDAFVDHIDISNARVSVNKKGTSDTSVEEAEALRKLGLGILYRTNVENDISQWRVGAKHYALHGLGVFKTVLTADLWLDKPIRKANESEEVYNKRLEEWQARLPITFPIAIQAVHPANVMPDPSHTGGQRLYVIERHTKYLSDALRIWPHLKLKKTENITDTVEYLSYWDKDFRCDLVDEHPVFKVRGGVVKHNYGFIPYVFIESGLGNFGKDAEPEKRYVGMLRYIYDVLVSESSMYSVADVIFKREAFLGGYIIGEGASAIGELTQEYGKYQPIDLAKGEIEIHNWEPQLPPNEIAEHLGRTHAIVSEHAAPRSVRGLGETGVRSGADRRLVIGEAALRYKYSSPAFQYGAARILENCAKLFKNVVPHELRVWNRGATEDTSFDVVIKQQDIDEPFNFHVEFAPISPEDEYRRHDDLLRLSNPQQGIVTKQWARTRMPDVDAVKMEREERKEAIRQHPMYQEILVQYAGQKMQQALTESGAPQMGQTPSQEGAPQAQGQRSLVPGVPERAPLGSGEDIENELAKLRSQMPMTATQGRGLNAGGNK